MLFKCDWVDYNLGLKHDEFNFTLVNFAHLLYRGNRNIDEPFILASQAQQAWYIQDPIDPDWHVALKMTPRAIFNVDPEVNEFESFEDEHVSRQQDETTINNESISWVGANVDSVIVVDPTSEDNVDNLDDEDEDDEDDYFSSDNSDSNDDDDDFFEDKMPSDENEND
ncbi:uncharacterized protein LOC131006680 [Salvia miltiorrhiza]|uniref:uncharacterized protein LOC131006680 n=1 Tax=Salvia miltiorrhiza TaxID=226208 RepID=UPI0025ABC080|nr:uncharacterized protein LOC131006680 [Salvia miltiorrhiza]